MPSITEKPSFLLRNETCFKNIPLVPERFHDVVDEAKRDGWTHLVNGGFSFVLERGPEVLKIFRDPGYVAFLDHAGDGGGFLPRFLAGCVNRENHVGIVRMEKLSRLPSHLCGGLADLNCDLEGIRASGEGSAVDLCGRLDAAYGAGFGTAVHAVYEMAVRNDLGLDMLEKNFMLRRSTGDVVITDPVFRRRPRPWTGATGTPNRDPASRFVR